MIKKDVLIIGAGPTGLFCAHQLGIIGLSCEILHARRESPPPHPEVSL